MIDVYEYEELAVELPYLQESPEVSILVLHLPLEYRRHFSEVAVVSPSAICLWSSNLALLVRVQPSVVSTMQLAKRFGRGVLLLSQDGLLPSYIEELEGLKIKDGMSELSDPLPENIASLLKRKAAKVV